MKLSQSFFYTLRENAKDEDSVSSNCWCDAGMIKKCSKRNLYDHAYGKEGSF